MTKVSLEPLDDRDVGKSAAFTHCLQTIALATGLQGVDQRRHQLGTRGTERMAERDGSAIDIQLCRIGPNRPQPGERYRCECFIDFIKIDVVDLHAGALERLLGRW